MIFNLLFLLTPLALAESLSTPSPSPSDATCVPLEASCKLSIENKFFRGRLQPNLIEGHRLPYLQKCASRSFQGSKCSQVLQKCDINGVFPCGRTLVGLYPDESNSTQVNLRRTAVHVCLRDNSTLAECPTILSKCADAVKAKKDNEKLYGDIEQIGGEHERCTSDEDDVPSTKALRLPLTSTVPVITYTPTSTPVSVVTPVIVLAPVVIVPIVYDQCDYHFLAQEALDAFNIQFNNEETAHQLLLNATSILAADVTAAAAFSVALKTTQNALAAATKTAKIAFCDAQLTTQHAAVFAQQTVDNAAQAAFVASNPIICDDNTIFGDLQAANALQSSDQNAAGQKVIADQLVASNLLITQTANFNQKHAWTETNAALVTQINARDAAALIVNGAAAAALNTNYVAYAAAKKTAGDAYAVTVFAVKSAKCFAQRVAFDAKVFAAKTVSVNSDADLLASLPVDCSYPTMQLEANLAWNLSFTNEINANNIVVSRLNAASKLSSTAASYLAVPLTFRYTALDVVVVTSNNARDSALLISAQAVAYAQLVHDKAHAQSTLTAAIAVGAAKFTAKAARCSALQTALGAAAYAQQTIDNTAEIGKVASMDCSSSVSNNANIASNLLAGQLADASTLLFNQTTAAKKLASDRAARILVLHDFAVTDPEIATSIAARDAAIDTANKAVAFGWWTIDTAIAVAKKLSQTTEASALLTAITAKRSSIGC